MAGIENGRCADTEIISYPYPYYYYYYLADLLSESFSYPRGPIGWTAVAAVFGADIFGRVVFTVYRISRTGGETYLTDAKRYYLGSFG